MYVSATTLAVCLMEYLVVLWLFPMQQKDEKILSKSVDKRERESYLPNHNCKQAILLLMLVCYHLNASSYELTPFNQPPRGGGGGGGGGPGGTRLNTDVGLILCSFTPSRLLCQSSLIPPP